MQKQTDISLLKYNSFGIDVACKEFISIEKDNDVLQIIENKTLKNKKYLFLGGGNNIVFTKDFDGVIIHFANKGVCKISEDENFVFVKAEAGEIWDDFVWQCLENQWFGLENLIAIPSSIGATAVQNIGAYGVEAKDFIHEVHTIDINTGATKVFRNSECKFGYRESIFKHPEGKDFAVMSVVFKLRKKAELQLTYNAINNYLKINNIEKPTPKELAQHISNIRWQKLPKPELIGSVGSFFKNPIVTPSHFSDLRAQYPDIVSYPAGDNFKLAAGWMIEKSGWKGKHLGKAGVYEKQALILINCGNCTGEDVTRLANAITADVENLFGVRLQPEAIII